MHGDGSVPSSATAGSTTRQNRTGRSRRSLPTGRALVGGLLVTVAAVVVFAAYAGAQSAPSSEVVVAARAIDAGRRLTSADLEVRTVAQPARTTPSFADLDQLVGAIALGPVAAGEVVQPGSVRLADPDAGDRRGPQFSFSVDRDRALNGDVRSGEQVDLLATFGSGASASTDVLARGAQVLDVEEAGAGTIGSTGRLVLTVALDSDRTVLDVAHASQVAAITVVRTDGAGS